MEVIAACVTVVVVALIAAATVLLRSRAASTSTLSSEMHATLAAYRDATANSLAEMEARVARVDERVSEAEETITGLSMARRR